MKKTRKAKTRNKKRGDLKNILGLTQEEMAMFLGVGMSQWNMFKSGKRHLPLEATLKLNALLQSVQKEKGVSDDARKLLAKEELETKKQLQEDEIKIEARLRRIQKEMAIIENNRTESFAALQTISQLEKMDVVNEGLVLIIRKRALQTLEKYNRHSLEELQCKQQSLEVMKKRIQEKLQAVGGKVQFPVEEKVAEVSR